MRALDGSMEALRVWLFWVCVYGPTAMTMMAAISVADSAAAVLVTFIICLVLCVSVSDLPYHSSFLA